MIVKQLFAPERDPSRPLNEVVNTEEDIDIRSEIDEYVFTNTTREYFRTLVDGLLDTSQGNSPDCLRGWISGFFGSGKSHFLKLAGALLENRRLRLPDGKEADALQYAVEKHDLKVAWQRLAREFKVRSVTVNLAMAHGGGKHAQDRPLLYRLAGELNRAAGYSAVPHIAQLEREIHKKRKWESFLKTVVDENRKSGNVDTDGRPLAWTDPGIRDRAYEAHVVLEAVLPSVLPHVGNPRAYLDDREKVAPDPDTVVDLAVDLAKTQHPDLGRVLLCVDEVALYLKGSGGFDGNRIREIQGLAERVKDKGKGKVFLFATAQLKVDTIDTNFAGLSEYVVFLRDRFPKGGRLELEERDIDTVVRERWLKKDPSSKGHAALEGLIKDHGGLLASATKLRDESLIRDTASLTDAKAVADYYPCLPYHIRLLQAILQALRGDQQIDQTAAQSRALLSAIRSLFVRGNGADLASAEVGALVTFDKAYDVIRDVVCKTDSVTDQRINEVIESLGACGSVRLSAVAKTIFLLQHLNPKGTRRIRVSAENVASLLYPRLGAAWEPHLKDVREACTRLVAEHFIGEEAETGFRFYREEEVSFQKLVDSQVVDESRMRARLEEALGNQAAKLELETLEVKRGHKLHVGTHVHFGTGSLPDPQATAKGLELHFVWPKAGGQLPNVKLLAAQFAEAPHAALWVLSGVGDAEDVARRLIKLEAAITEHANRHGHQGAALLKGEQAKADTLRDETLPQLARAAIEGGTVIHRGVDTVLAGGGKKAADVFDETMREALDQVFPHLEDGSASLDDASLRKVFTWKPPQAQPDFMSGLKLFDAGGAALVDRPFLKEIELALKLFAQENQRTGKALVEHFARPPYGWPERVVKAGLGALLRARRVIVKLSDGGILRSETDAKAETWLTGSQQFNKAVVEPSQVTLTMEERLLLTRLCTEVLGNPGLDSVEKLEREVPTLVKEHLAAAREALADLQGRQLPGTAAAQVLVSWLQPATEPDLVAGKLKQLAVGARAVAGGQDAAATLRPHQAVVDAVTLLRKQSQLAPLAGVAQRARALYPGWRQAGHGHEVAADLEALGAQSEGVELLTNPQRAFDRDARCFGAYATDYAQRHRERQDHIAQAQARLHVHPAWAKASEAEREHWLADLGALGCNADGVLSLEEQPDGQCPDCRASLPDLLRSLEQLEAREGRALRSLDALAAPPAPPKPPQRTAKRLEFSVRGDEDRRKALEAIESTLVAAPGRAWKLTVEVDELGD